MLAGFSLLLMFFFFCLVLCTCGRMTCSSSSFVIPLRSGVRCLDLRRFFSFNQLRMGLSLIFVPMCTCFLVCIGAVAIVCFGIAGLSME